MNKPQILIIEDDNAIGNLISTTLETQHYQYRRAKNGASGVLEAASCRPDVILLDLGLPDMDGVDIIKKVRTSTLSPRFRADTWTWEPGGVYLMALLTMLMTTCTIRRASILAMSMSSGSSTVMVCSLAFRSRWVRASWNTSSSSSGSIFRRMVPFSAPVLTM